MLLESVQIFGVNETLEKHMLIRRIGLYAMACLLLSSTALADISYQFKEGLDYNRLNAPMSGFEKSEGKQLVVEIFRYGCAGCYQLEIEEKAWLSNKSKNIDYEVIPFTTPGELTQMYSRVFYTIESLGKKQTLHKAFFSAIHNDGRSFQTEGDVAEFFTQNGIDKDVFKNHYYSQQVSRKIKRARKISEHIPEVHMPAIIVNGEYLIEQQFLFPVKAYFKIVNQIINEE